MRTIYLGDITGTLGEWLDEGFDYEVSVEVVKLLQEAYELAIKEYERED